MVKKSDPELPFVGDNEAQSRPTPVPPRDSVAALARLVKPAVAVDLPSEPMQEFFLPVHGFVRLTRSEARVVSHPAMQRLGSIYQLGQAHLVFRGATHTRLEHCLGAVHVASRMMDEVDANQRNAVHSAVEGEVGSVGEQITPTERTFVRIAALLHDIGHLPTGHTLEDELGLLNKHDYMERLNLVLDKTDWPGGKVEPLRHLIDNEYRGAAHGAAASDVILAVISKDSQQVTQTTASALIRLSVCRDIVGNTICADLLDYLYRDWYHVGKPQYVDERLFQYMEIRKDAKGEDCFVVSLGQRPKLRTDAISAILRLLESRYELAETVLFHRTKCAAAAMLERGLQELAASVKEPDRPAWTSQLTEKLLTHTDQGAIDLFLSEASQRGAEAAIGPLSGLRQRALYKNLLTATHQEITPDRMRKIEDMYRGSKGAAARLRAVKLLELDFGLPPGSLAMYCPDKGMNEKIPQVRVRVNGQIDTFSHWDDEHHEDLSGGHVRAQKNRFRRLWRVYFVIREDVLRKQSETVVSWLRSAIRECVLGLTMSEETPSIASRRIAASLIGVPGSPHAEKTLTREPSLAARGSADPTLFYSTGAPTVRSQYS
jgi:HD superfamily phosphohydrolase